MKAISIRTLSDAKGRHREERQALDRWADPLTGEDVMSSTIVVSGASEWMIPYHDRMPVLLAEQDLVRGLYGRIGPDELGPTAEEALREWTVLSRMNKLDVGDDDPRTVKPAA